MSVSPSPHYLGSPLSEFFIARNDPPNSAGSEGSSDGSLCRAATASLACLAVGDTKERPSANLFKQPIDSSLMSPGLEKTLIAKSVRETLGRASRGEQSPRGIDSPACFGTPLAYRASSTPVKSPQIGAASASTPSSPNRQNLIIRRMARDVLSSAQTVGQTPGCESTISNCSSPIQVEVVRKDISNNRKRRREQSEQPSSSSSSLSSGLSSANSCFLGILPSENSACSTSQESSTQSKASEEIAPLVKPETRRALDFYLGYSEEDRGIIPQLNETIKRAKITTLSEWQRVGVCGSYLAVDQEKKLCIIKPADEARGHPNMTNNGLIDQNPSKLSITPGRESLNEAAAYILSQDFFASSFQSGVPLTWLTMLESNAFYYGDGKSREKLVSCQKFIDNSQPVAAYYGEEDRALARILEKTQIQQNMRRTALFDLLVRNTDRNPGNLLISPSGDVFLVDHGCILPSDCDEQMDFSAWFPHASNAKQENREVDPGFEEYERVFRTPFSDEEKALVFDDAKWQAKLENIIKGIPRFPADVLHLFELNRAFLKELIYQGLNLYEIASLFTGQNCGFVTEKTSSSFTYLMQQLEAIADQDFSLLIKISCIKIGSTLAARADRATLSERDLHAIFHPSFNYFEG